MTSSGRIRGLMPGMLLGLLLLTGCSTLLQKASPGTKDVCLRLAARSERSHGFGCGDDAVRQVIQYYQPQIKDENIKTESLLFVKANDTVSLLQCLNDNMAIHFTMQNATVEGLLGRIAAGDPVIVFVPGDAFVVGGIHLFGTLVVHCIVGAGYRANETELFFYSDGEGPYVISREVFAHQWARVDNLCITPVR